MCIFHKWTRWEDYFESGKMTLGRIMPKNVQGKEVPYRDLRQARRCIKCGIKQDRLVKENA